MKKIVVIGANDFQNQLILKAKALGYETHVFAWQCGDVGEKTADFFYPVSIVEKEQILEECKKIKPDGICSIASDLAAITVNYVAEKLNLPCNATKYTEIQTNKYAMRKALSQGGIPCPKFVIAGEGANLDEAVADFSYPIIVKPTDRSGSRSITKLESADGLENAVKEACDVSFEKKSYHRGIFAGQRVQYGNDKLLRKASFFGGNQKIYHRCTPLYRNRAQTTLRFIRGVGGEGKSHRFCRP